MRSQSTDVTQYLQEVPVEQQASLKKLRELCLNILTDYEEKMERGMPCYKQEGKVIAAFASHKQHIALYLYRDCVIENNLALLKKLSIGKTVVRFRRPDHMDFDLIKKLLFDTHNAQNLSC